MADWLVFQIKYVQSQSNKVQNTWTSTSQDGYSITFYVFWDPRLTQSSSGTHIKYLLIKMLEKVLVHFTAPLADRICSILYKSLIRRRTEYYWHICLQLLGLNLPVTIEFRTVYAALSVRILFYKLQPFFQQKKHRKPLTNLSLFP